MVSTDQWFGIISSQWRNEKNKYLREIEIGYLLPTVSVTRFGKISSLWQNFKSLWLFFESLFCIGKNFKRSYANFHGC